MKNTLFILLMLLSVLSQAQTTIWSVDFETGYSDNDETAQDNNAPAGADWTKSGSPSNYWRVESSSAISGSLSMSGRNLDGVMTWTSETISLTGYTDIGISILIGEAGHDNDGDYIRTYYDIGSGYVEFGAGNGEGNFGGTATNSITGLAGTSLSIRVLMENDDADDRGMFDDIVVTGTPGATFGYTGPGGVGDDGTNEVWLIAEGNTYTDAGSTAATDSDEIQQWSDFSGNGNNATQTTPANKPELNTNVLNGFSSVEFDGSSTRMLVNSIATGDEMSMFLVFQMNSFAGGPNPGLIQAGPGGNNFSSTASDKVIGTWVSSTTDEIWGRGVESGGSIQDITQTTALSASQFYVLTQDYDGTDITQYVDGATAGTVGYDGTLGSWTDFGIGRQGSESFDGDFAEIIVFKEHLNLARRIIVQNYLSAKYGLLLSGVDYYNEDSNGDYDYDVAGIGQATDGSQHDDAQGTGIFRINNPSALNANDEFLFWGHDNESYDLVTSDLPAGVTSRIAREWRASQRGEVGTVDVTVDLSSVPISFSAASLRFMIDKNTNNSYADETVGIYSNAIDLGGGLYQWTGVNLDNNERFTIGFATLGHLGPGGVGSVDGSDNLTLWLDASTVTGVADGANMGTWFDESGYNNDAFVDAGAPNYQATGGGNSQPSISFEDNNTENFRVVTNAQVIPTQAISVFVAGNYENGSDSWASFINSSDDDAWNDGWGIGEDNNTGDMIHYIDDYNGTFCNTVIDSDYGTDHVWSLLYDTDDSRIDGYKSENSCTDNFTGPMNYDLGRNDDLLIGCGPDNGGPNYFITGDINEVVLYDLDINDAQRIIVTNYLAAKYEITLANNNVYNEDENGDYDFDVAGIGQDGNGEGHYDAQGTGIVRINSASDIDNNEYYMWGHDNGSLNSFAETDFPIAELESRIERVWRGSMTGDIGTISISFDLSALGSITTDDLRLCLDLDTDDGLFINEPTSSFIAGATKDGDIYTWSGVTIPDNIRFTIGSVNETQTPLPIELGRFDAQATPAKNVELRWNTYSEFNNDYFSIEKSLDGESWEHVSHVKGAGNSTRQLNYLSKDQNPYLGISYYRLKQTDFDGSITYSETRAVNVEEIAEELSIYPVPSSDRITVESNLKDLSNFRVYNTLGADLSNLVDRVMNADGIMVLDISQLESGLYFFRTENTTARFIKN